LQWTPDRVPFAGDASTNPKGPVDVLVIDHVEKPTED
jgi:hypothetical protein